MLLFIFSCEDTGIDVWPYEMSKPEKIGINYFNEHTIELFWDIHPRGGNTRFSLTRKYGNQEVLLDSVINAYTYIDSTLNPGVDFYTYKLTAYDYYDTNMIGNSAYLNVEYSPSNFKILELNSTFHVSGLIFSNNGEIFHYYGGSSIITLETKNWASVKTINDKDNNSIKNLTYCDSIGIYAYSTDNKIKIFDTATDSVIRTIDFSNICKFALSKDGNTIIVSNFNGQLKKYKIKDTAFNMLIDDSLYAAWDIDITPDGTKIIYLASNTFNVYDIESGALLYKFGNTDPHVDEIIISSDDQRLLGYHYKNIYSWDSKTFDRSNIISTNLGSCWAIAESPDQKYIIASDNYLLKVFDEEKREYIRTLSGHTNLIFHLAYSPADKIFISSCLDDKIIIWSEDTIERWHIK